jgi:Bacterial regulatory helix-turn-helix protein, lysR family
VELQQLRGFLAAAKTASITEAAHQLRLTPSSVSVQIKKLEQELGVRLFDDICVPKAKISLRVVDVTSIFGVSDVNLISRKNKFLSRADIVFIETVLTYRKNSRIRPRQ